MATIMIFRNTLNGSMKQFLLSRNEFCKSRRSFFHICSSSNITIPRTRWRSWANTTVCRRTTGGTQHFAPRVSGIQLPLRCMCTGNSRASDAHGDEDQTADDKQIRNDVVKVKSWAFQLTSPFGKLMINKTAIPAKIVPANPHDYPAGDRVFVHLLGSISDMSKDSNSAHSTSSLFQDVVASIDCSLDEQGISLSHNDLHDTTQLAFLIEVPTCYDVQVSSCEEGHISVESLENEECNIRTEKGNITLKSMKSAQVNIQSGGGNISCLKALQGSGMLETVAKGCVTADRLQGLDFSVSTEAGPVHIRDIYARQSTVSSQTGPITISNMHTTCTVSTSADVNTSCVEGTLSVNISGSGSFSGYLSRHDSADIQTEKGDIELKVPEDCRSLVELTGQNVDIDPGLVFRNTQPSDSKTKIGDLCGGGGEEAKITARTQEGSITIKTLTWFDSLGLAR